MSTINYISIATPLADLLQEEYGENAFIGFSKIKIFCTTDHFAKLILTKCKTSSDLVKVLVATKLILSKRYSQTEIMDIITNLYVYILFFYDDQEKIDIECTKCDGDGTEECYQCDGEGLVDCKYCDGEGTEDCDECGGEGTEDCRHCDGYGRNDDDLDDFEDDVDVIEKLQDVGYYTVMDVIKSGLENVIQKSGIGKEKVQELFKNIDKYGLCVICDGSGQEKCRNCRGKGNFKCTECDGTGKDDCPECGGGGNNTCTRCDGYGAVRTKDYYYNITKRLYVTIGNELSKYTDTIMLIDKFEDIDFEIEGFITNEKYFTDDVTVDKRNDSVDMDDYFVEISEGFKLENYPQSLILLK